MSWPGSGGGTHAQQAPEEGREPQSFELFRVPSPSGVEGGGLGFRVSGVDLGPAKLSVWTLEGVLDFQGVGRPR